MFSWMSKDEERKKNADVYSSVTAGLQNVYRTKLLPLEKVIYRHRMICFSLPLYFLTKNEHIN